MRSESAGVLQIGTVLFMCSSRTRVNSSRMILKGELLRGLHSRPDARQSESEKENHGVRHDPREVACGRVKHPVCERS